MSAFLDSLTEDQRRIHEALCDSSYMAGARAGWNCGLAEDTKKFEAIERSRRGHLVGVKEALSRIESKEPKE